MLKNYSIFAVGALMSFATLFGTQKETPKVDTDLYSGGFVTGLGITTLGDWGLSAGLVNLGYYAPCWMIDVGASAGTISKSKVAALVLGHLGLRNRLYQNLSISYGLMGLGQFVSEATWSAGVFAGLDYQLSKHFLLSGKIYPYNYEHTRWRPTHSIFANSTISLFYVF